MAFAGLSLPTAASATFSIVACDDSGDCGAAVATNNLAVGASVIYAQAGVGAIATQFETNPSYGPKGLALLAQGTSAPATLQALLDGDGNFDGQDIRERQVGIVAASGPGTAYSGSIVQRSDWAGTLTGDGFSVQGNGLAGPAVTRAMRDAFLAAKGPLAERLLAAIEAGEKAGGQANGRLSAALLVRTREGGWQDIDLRVDAAAQPIPDLRRLLNMRRAHDKMIEAERAARAGHTETAQAAMADAARLAPGWDRIWRRIALLAVSLGDRAQVRTAFSIFEGLNPVWAKSTQVELLSSSTGGSGPAGQ
jgi:uncharacterized Ntn-hydrolase superfamily protein